MIEITAAILLVILLCVISFYAGAAWGANVFEKAYIKKREELKAARNAI